MGQVTEISWCHHTFNVAWGCTRVSPACEHCYAEAWAARHGVGWGPKATRRTFGEKHWADPIRWAKAAKRAGERRRVFCSSMADVFEDHPTIAAERRKLWHLIDETCDALDWLLLTKRIERVAAALAEDGLPAEYLVQRGVWLGATVEDRKHGLPRLDVLRGVPAWLRFASAEPLLQDLGRIDLSGISWVISGGESGPKARPSHPDWFRSLRDQCVAAGVAFHFKQWGEWVPVSRPTDADEVVWAANSYLPRGRWLDIDGGDKHRSWDTVMVDRVGKKMAGRLLDGVEWSQFPEPKGVAR